MKIRHKITLWVAGAGLLTSLAFTLVVFFEMREQPLEILDSQLESTAVALAKRLASDSKPFEVDRSTALFIPGQLYWIKVFDANLNPVYHSDLAALVELPFYRDRGDDGYTASAHIPRGSFALNQNEKDQVAFRVRVIKAEIAGTPCLIQIARPMEKLEEELSGLLAALGIGLTVSTLMLVIVSYVFAGRIVRPVAAISRLTREINEKTLEKRIPLGPNHDELYELSVSLNRMFDRLQYSFARQRQFLADASHELKSPVAMLRLFFEEAAQHQELPEALQDQLSTQVHHVLRMDRLIKTLLELSVLELKESLALESFSLTDLVRSVLEDFSPFMSDAGIRLTVRMPERLDMRGDKDKIRRLLINIVDNAVKYNQANGEVRLEAREKDGAVHLALTNSSPGIPKDAREKVFEHFYRVEKSRSPEYGGAGPGLAIVKQIVRLHHGRVSIDSVSGEWTRIDIILPVERD
jgi:two-component system, OmpR family, sensor kinase